jgi:hypothetical protein
LGENLAVLRQGRPAHVAYDTAFFISWPEHLGGGSVELRLRGTMLLVPFFAHAGDGRSEPAP